MRRPWYRNENVSVGKTIRTSQSARIDVRVEAFNTFNRIVWGEPELNFSSNNFGVVSGQANTPRQMQLGLKL